MRLAFSACFLAIALGTAASSYGQDSLTGTYSGSYVPATSPGAKPRGVQLTIASEENGVIKGTLRLSFAPTGTGVQNPCGGEYQMEGKVEEGKLVIRSIAKGGSASDCSFSLNAIKEGNKLVGTTGTTGKGSPLTLSK